ncbi:MAG: hypothetical protein O3B43_00515 [Chloroflexi bacterium]|nr:hypothetical protein [Chloroflexota bacterium]
MNNSSSDMETITLGETENFIAWRVTEPDGEDTYHVELSGVTLHFFEEEWREFLDLLQKLT